MVTFTNDASTHAPPPVEASINFRFRSLYDPLVALLNSIKSAASQGNSLPASTGAQPGTTDTGAKAYGEAHGKASDAIKQAAATLSPDQVDFLSGLGFTDPSDVDKKRTDILNSLLSAYDAPAAKYMKNLTGDGDGLLPALKQRLIDFDAAVNSQAKVPVSPDT